MGRFRLLPLNRYVITRPVDSAARFVFVTDQARRHVGSIGTDVANFGSIVRVCFYPQAGMVEAMANQRNVQRARAGDASLTAAGHSATALSLDASEPAAAAAGERAPEFVSGGTVLRGRSSQQINVGLPMYTSNVPHATLELRLVGEANARQRRLHAN